MLHSHVRILRYNLRQAYNYIYRLIDTVAIIFFDDSLLRKIYVIGDFYKCFIAILNSTVVLLQFLPLQ